MPKVTLNKSTKIKGKGLVRAGEEIDVTAEQKKQLEKDGFLGEAAKSNTPSNEKEIKELVAKVATLKAQVKDGGDTSALTDEIETLKGAAVEDKETIGTLNSENETLKSNIVIVEGSNNDLLLANKNLEAEVKKLKADLAKATKK